MYPQPYSPLYTPPPLPPAPRRNRAPWLLVALCLALVAVGASLLAAAVIGQPQAVAQAFPFAATHISGVVYGENAADRLAGRAVTPQPVAGAVVACGQGQAVTDARGRYALTALKGRTYTCGLTAPTYAPMAVTIRPGLRATYTLNFGVVAKGAQALAGCAPTQEGMGCPALALQAGGVSGEALNRDSHAPIGFAPIACWDNSLVTRNGSVTPQRYSASAAANGRYHLTDMPPGPYLCVANETGAPQPVTVQPGAISTLNFSVCAKHCPGVVYHQGPVMHSFTAYVVYWTPPGWNLDPNGNNTQFRALTQQYLKDVGGTPFFGLLTQYWDEAGPVRNAARLGGVYVDTKGYPHAATRSDPLTDKDIYAELARVRDAQGWKVTPDAGFIMITAYGAQVCASFSDGKSCTFQQGSDQGFCGYHTAAPYYAQGSTQNYMPYMYVADTYGCTYLPTFNYSRAPYGAQAADAIINTMSHEQFEMVTDPQAKGWYSGSGSDGEIADKCETAFGPTAYDGATVTLAHGHGYVVQEEWSNRANGCSYQ